MTFLSFYFILFIVCVYIHIYNIYVLYTTYIYACIYINIFKKRRSGSSYFSKWSQMSFWYGSCFRDRSGSHNVANANNANNNAANAGAKASRDQNCSWGSVTAALQSAVPQILSIFSFWISILHAIFGSVKSTIIWSELNNENGIATFYII